MSKESRKLLRQLRKSGVDIPSIRNKHELEWLVNHPSFERYPVCIEEFIKNKYFLGAFTCRKSVMKKMIEIFGDQKYVDKNTKKIMKYEEVVDVEGIGGGKTFSASLFILYGVYRLLCLKSPQEYYGKSPKTSIYFMLMSTSQKNARDVIFGEINARITSNEDGIFNRLYPPDPDIITQLVFDKDIFVIPGNSSEAFFVGYNIFMAVIDECDDHKKTKEKDYVVEGYMAIGRRILSRFPGIGGIMMIGSPKSTNGFMMRMHRRAEGDDSMLGVHLATWEALDPKEFPSGRKFIAKDPYGKIHHIPIEYKKKWEQNPERFWRDLGAIPSFTIEPFITLTERINICFNPDLATWDGKDAIPAIVGSGKKEYIAHVDLGVNVDGSDHCAIAIGHIAGSKEVVTFGGRAVERPFISMDFTARLSAVSGQEIQISEVRRMLLYLKDQGFEYYRVQFDGWESKDSQQILRKVGIRVKQVSVDKDMFAYEAVKEAMYDKRLEYGILLVESDIKGEGNKLINIIRKEFLELSRIKGKKVDHPIEGSKDTTDSIAGVVLGLTETKTLHKIGISYTPRYVRDNLSIETIKTKHEKRQSHAKGFKSSQETSRGIPKIVGGNGIW